MPLRLICRSFKVWLTTCSLCCVLYIFMLFGCFSLCHHANVLHCSDWRAAGLLRSVHIEQSACFGM